LQVPQVSASCSTEDRIHKGAELMENTTVAARHNLIFSLLLHRDIAGIRKRSDKATVTSLMPC